MSDEKKVDAETLQQMVTSAGKKLFGKDLLVLGVIVISIVGMTLSIKSSFAQSNQTQIDAGLIPIIEEVRALKMKEEAQAAINARVDARFYAFSARVDARFDIQETDIRALYRAMMTGEKQKRLEQPAPPPVPSIIIDAGRQYDTYARDAGR